MKNQVYKIKCKVDRKLIRNHLICALERMQYEREYKYFSWALVKYQMLKDYGYPVQGDTKTLKEVKHVYDRIKRDYSYGSDEGTYLFEFRYKENILIRRLFSFKPF